MSAPSATKSSAAAGRIVSPVSIFFLGSVEYAKIGGKSFQRTFSSFITGGGKAVRKASKLVTADGAMSTGLKYNSGLAVIQQTVLFAIRIGVAFAFLLAMEQQ